VVQEKAGQKNKDPKVAIPVIIATTVNVLQNKIHLKCRVIQKQMQGHNCTVRTQ